jgi:uncharacterized protein DUF1629
MYFRLECELNLASGLPNQENNIGEHFLRGKPADESDLDLPFEFELAVDASKGDLLLSDYYSGDNLMSRKLVDAIRACGVDNLQTFPAVITRDDNGEKIENYVVVNIIGLVAAADMGKSKSRPLADVKFFEKLAVDPDLAKGHMMFRLAESRLDIIVAENVAKAIEAGNFQDVTLEPLE